jgi:SecD/SecF fusion protein
MRNNFRTLFIVLLLLTGAIYVTLPPEKNLRLGKDLRGGASLVYAIQVDPGENPDEIIPQTIEILKERVDPDGVLEVSMVQQGRDRIEISMPLPSERVKALRRTFEAELVKLGKAQVTENRVDLAVRRPASERDQALTELSAGSAVRLANLRSAATAYDALQAAMQAVRDAGTSPSVQLLAAAADAEKAYADARRNVMRTALAAEDIRAAAFASKRSRRMADENRVMVDLPSPRDQAVARLKAQHPDAESIAEIDRLIGLFDAYAAERTGFDDPADLKRILKGAGVLTFRITVDPGQHPEEARLRTELREVGAKNVRANDARWFEINDVETWVDSKAELEFVLASDDNAREFFRTRGYTVENRNGQFYMLSWDTRNTRLTPADGAWRVEATGGVDQFGRPAINFTMSTSGAPLLGALTRDHIGDKMAILLDDQVYTAPNLNSEISSTGQITGKFSQEDIRYVVRVLSGGSLQAKLVPEPISESTFGPELGADNLRMGLRAGILSAIAVTIFMVLYYFGFGMVAVIALVANSILILGAMSLAKASFTMPGIAGVILTFGMAVDSNVLIYERMREEFRRGADMKTSVRLGFDKALSAIVDSNITNLIVCLALYGFGTPEIRGFAITMGIGVVSTLIAALVISRLVFNLLVAAGWRWAEPTRLTTLLAPSSFMASMLPMSFPAVQRFLTPNIDWMRLRYVFFFISAVYVLLGLSLVFVRGEKMLDNEFLGGTQVTLSLRQDPATGERITMERSEVQERVNAIANAAPEGDELRLLRDAEVLPIDPRADGVTSDTFSIKTTAENASAVLGAVRNSFADKLDLKPPLEFTSSEATALREIPAFAIEKRELGDNIDRPAFRNPVAPFLGGVAVLIENISPAPTIQELTERLNTARNSAEFSDTLSRDREVVVLEGSEQSVKTAVLLVRAEGASVFENEARWEQDLKLREWALVREALTRETTPASVNNFTSSVARTFAENAIKAALLSFVGIGIYIWIRFKTPRYSLAAVVALIHDVLTVVGLLALCEILYDFEGTASFARSIGLLPFKIDLNMVAALLTIAGYSLNDTVVVMDRIRENRGKLPHATRSVINDSINQTFSRTIITGTTTVASCIILYVVGGEGMRAFAFALLAGLIVGTYSSVAVAAPIVWSRKSTGELETSEEPKSIVTT